MLICEYIDIIKPKVHNKGEDCKITGAYAGDFLSFVMGRAEKGNVWFTIMNNINVAGVAVLAELPCIVLCEDVQPDTGLKEKCIQKGITLLTTADTVYNACVRFDRINTSFKGKM